MENQEHDHWAFPKHARTLQREPEINSLSTSNWWDFQALYGENDSTWMDVAEEKTLEAWKDFMKNEN